MGLSIISIVIFHFTEDCHDSGINYSLPVRLFYTKLGSSSVDIFIILSGFGLYYALKKKPKILDFFKKRYKRIAVPYLLVAIPSWFTRDFFIENKGLEAFFSDLLFLNTKTWFWFIKLILIAYLFFPLLFVIIDKPKSHFMALLITAFIFIAFTAVTYYLFIYHKGIYDDYQIMLLRFPHFALGCLLGRLSYYEVNYNKKYLILGAILLIPCYFLLHSHFAITLRYTRAYVNLFLCAFFITAFDLIKDNKFKEYTAKILRFFGSITLELYLVHVSLRYFFFVFKHPTYQYINELIMVIISILIAYVIHRVVGALAKDTPSVV